MTNSSFSNVSTSMTTTKTRAALPEVFHPFSFRLLRTIASWSLRAMHLAALYIEASKDGRTVSVYPMGRSQQWHWWWVSIADRRKDYHRTPAQPDAASTAQDTPPKKDGPGRFLRFLFRYGFGTPLCNIYRCTIYKSGNLGVERFYRLRWQQLRLRDKVLTWEKKDNARPARFMDAGQLGQGIQQANQNTLRLIDDRTKVQTYRLDSDHKTTT